eukprot:3166104-Rhodomonas_salina.1
MRKLALGVAPGSQDARAAEMVEDLERKSKGGKVIKSRCCRLCPKTIRPSFFDWCTMCEICDENLVETKCLKEGLTAIARSEDTLDAKGLPDFKMPEAGLAHGRLRTVLKGTRAGTTWAGMIGYSTDAAGKVLFRFHCPTCADSSRTPGKKLEQAAPDSDEEEA